MFLNPSTCVTPCGMGPTGSSPGWSSTKSAQAADEVENTHGIVEPRHQLPELEVALKPKGLVLKVGSFCTAVPKYEGNKVLILFLRASQEAKPVISLNRNKLDLLQQSSPEVELDLRANRIQLPNMFVSRGKWHLQHPKHQEEHHLS